MADTPSHTLFMPTQVGIHVFGAAIWKVVDGLPSQAMTRKAPPVSRHQCRLV
jgi:hypothetical protein